MSAKQQVKKELESITVRLPPTLVRDLKMHAVSESTPIQTVVEQAVVSYLRGKRK